MPESVELHFRYTEDEYVSAIRSYMLAKRRVAFFVGIASVVTLLGIYFLITQSDGAAAISFLVTGAFLFGLLATSLVILPHRRFKANPQFRRDYYLQFAEDGILFRTDQLDATLSGRSIQKHWKRKSSTCFPTVKVQSQSFLRECSNLVNNRRTLQIC
jgi:hypothetical protein